MKLLFTMLMLSSCASWQDEFMRGYNSVNGPGGAGDQISAFTNALIIQAAQTEGWGKPSQTPVEDFKLIPRAHFESTHQGVFQCKH